MLASSFQFQYIAHAVKKKNHDPMKLKENTAYGVVHTINTGHYIICVHVGQTICCYGTLEPNCLLSSYETGL